MRPWPEPGARKEEEAMKKLFALLMALTMTVQLVTPAWADAVEDGPEESTEAVEVVEETTEATEETEVPEETEAETEETEATEKVTEPESEAGETTEEPTEETAEPTETGEEAEDEQVVAVAALIEALPSVEELEGMTEEEQLAAYEQIQGAFDAYDALPEEQKLLISGAEEAFEALFAYFNNQVEPVAIHKHPVCGDVDCTAHTQATFYSWDGVSGFNGSYIYLDQDAVRDNSISIRGSVTICLNGHTISTNGESPVFYVPSGSTLKICDCKGSGKLISDAEAHNLCSSAETGIETYGGTVWVYSGTVEGNDAGISAFGGKVCTYGGQVNSRSGSGISLGGTAKLIVKGGSITGEVGINGDAVDTSIIMSAGSVSSIDSLGELSLNGGTVEGRATANTFYLYDSPAVDLLYSPSTIILKSKNDDTRTYTGDPFSLLVDDTNKKVVVDNLNNPELARQITLVSVDGSADGHITGRLEYTNQTLIQDIPIEKGLTGDVQWALYDNGDFFLEGNGMLPDYENQNLRGITPWSDYSSRIKKLYVGPGITRIGTNAFRNTGLEYVSFGTASLSLGDNCFYECRNLTQIDFGTGTICPDEAVFAWCTSLKSVTIPANVKMNGQYSDEGSGYQLFFRCGLTSAVVECAYVGPFVFESCYSLNTVTFTDRNVKFYYVENDSGHPFNANGSGIINAYGYLCSEVSALVEKSVGRYGVKLAFAPINGDTTEHTEKVVPAVPPTCIATGLTEGKVCSVCGTILQAQKKVEATGHILEAVEAKESTCAEDGCVAHWACTVCGATFSDAEGTTKTDPTIAKKAHTEVIDEAVAPTCMKTGLTEGKHCSVCNEVLVAQKEVPAIDHSVDAWTVTRQATCTEEGEEQGTCSVCGNTATKAIPVLGHNMTKTEAVEPTYWAVGNNAYYTCTRCGKVYKDEAGKTETTVEAETLEKLPGVASGECGEKLHWALTEEGTLTISGEGRMPDYSTSSVAPWYNKRTKILSVVIEPGVTGVGSYAFNACLKLASISLPGSVNYIGKSAFRDCSKLTEIEIPEGVSSIGSETFYNCVGLKNVVLPDGLQSIGGHTYYDYGAFENCTSLKSIIIPEGVTRIVGGTFYNCTSLENVTLPESLRVIEDNYNFLGAFKNCSSLKSIIIPEGATHIGSLAFYDCKSLTNVSIPESVTGIGWGAFHGCINLSNITIPDSVTSIGGEAFYECSLLSSVRMPEGLTKIERETFYGCTNLISVEIPEGITSIEKEAFQGCSSLTSVIIPEGVTSIGYEAFSGCIRLKSVVLPESLASIGYSAFSGCSSLTSVSIPDGVTSIEDGTFSGCSSLTSVSIPDSVTSIEDGTFSGCSSLTSVSIPDSVTSIGKSAFNSCSSLTSITIPEGVSSLEYQTFYNCTSLESVTLPEGLVSIADRSNGGVFENCTSLKSIVIPDSVTSIGSYAFRGCSSLTSVSIGDSVTSIGSYAFYGCNSLASITIPEGVTSLEYQTFYNCTSLESVTLPESLVSIADRYNGGVFENCTSLKSIVVPDSVTSIGSYAFDGCSGLTSVSIGERVASIGSGAFSGCSSLTSIVVPDSVTSIGSSAFSDCSSLTNITIPKGVTSIEVNTFYNCTGLESVAIPDSVTSIGSSAFQDCSSLKSITIPEGITSIERHTFYDCTALTSVGIPASVINIKDYAFYGCSNLKDVYYGGDEVAWKQIEIGDSNGCLTRAYLHYGLTHICTTHLIPAVAPTCTTAGNNAYYLCDACGRVYKDEQNREQTTVENENLPALGHAMTLTEAKAATCTEDGNNAYYTCGNCHKVFLDEQGEKETTAQAEILPALGHSISIVNTVAPTCTEKGNRLYYTCATCGKAFKDKGGLEATTVAAETVPALGHTMTKTEAVAPTCTEKGTNAYYTCETCGKVFRDALGKQETTVEAEVLAALGHSMVLTEAKEPTCTETGNHAYYTCKTCGKVYQDEAGEKATTVADENIPALGHTMTKTEAVVPTCTESGNNAYYTCETCHKVYKDEAGTQETTAQAEILKALGHSMTQTKAKAPTCTTAGTNGYYTCGTCHKVFKDQQGTQETTVAAEVLNALGHSMVKTEAKAPTCTESGNNAYYTCQTCYGVFKDEAGKQATTVSAEQLAAFGHSMARTAAKEATCTTDGNHTYYTCRTCGKVYKNLQGTEETTVKAETIAALGHTMERTNVVAPTCTESGNNTYYTCATCQKVFKDQQGKQETTVRAETVAALGHSMTKTEAITPTCTESGNNAYYTCKTCRKVFKDEMGREETTVQAETIVALGHSMAKTEAVAPTCTEAGNNAYFTCSTCHKVFKDEAGKRLTTVSAETLAAFGHSMVRTAAKEATCAAPGNNTYYTCRTCGKVYQDEAGEKETTVKAETIPALGHAMTKTEAVAPTCTESGNNAYYTCSTCHKVYKDEMGKQETTVQGEFLPALGHDMVETPAVAPTHTTGGNNAYYTCSTCHKVFADEQGTRETTPEQERLPRLPGMADGKSGSLTWFISDEGKLTISGKGRMPDYSGSALAPWYDYREKILALEVEEGVLSMGDYAFFDCENLKTIQLPKSLTKLGKSCFVGCDSLALLDLTQLPKELTQKVTDLTGLAVLPETLSKLAGSKASYQWRLETIEGQPAAKNLAKLDGSQLTVLRSGAFRLVCLEEYTGLEASIQAAAQTTTVIRPEEREQLTSGEKLELSAWAMPFETELTADWTVTEESQAYATVTKDGILTAKSITKPVQVTVRAVPKNGEDPAEKTIWLLPKTIGMGILVNGHLVGDSLTVELTEAELNLTAQIQPQGAKTEVTWTSSREDVAEISAAGTVKLLKPGITLIRAQSTDGSGVSAELTLKVQYLDGAEKLTLTADAAVLELGRTAQLTLSGEDTIDPEYVEFQITQGNAAAVDAQGLLTAGNVPGKVTIVAALKDDPLQRRAQLTVEIVPVLIRALILEPQVSQEWGYAEETSGESWVYGEVEAVAGKNRTFQINAQGKDYREQWFGVTNLTYESSDPAVAQVDAKGLVTLTAKEAGACVITVRCTDTLGTETRLHIVLRDSAPRLESTKLTLNSNLIAGVTTGLVESCGNTIQSVTLYDYNKTTKDYTHSTAFDAEAEDGTLTVRALGAQKSGTYQLKLVVTCLGGSYDYTLQVKVANSLPKVTVKQIGKFDTFYLDSTAQLTATASGYEVERLKLIGADTFRMDEDGNLFYAESYNPGDKIVTKGTLLIYVEGYQVPVEKAVTIATTKTAPKLTLNPSASAVNRVLEDPEFRVKVLWKGNALDLTDAEVKADVGFATVEAQGQYLVFRLTGATGGTAKLSLRLPGWAQAVSLTHKVTVENKLPTVKLGTPTLKLNSLFSAQTARTSVWLTQGNLDISTMDFKAAREEGKCIDLSFDPETDSIEAKFNPEIPKPKAGTYSYTYTAYLENGTALPNGTIKVTVAATAPKVKLSTASVKLNRYLAGQEKATVKVTLTGGTGYQVTDFEDLPDYMRYDAETRELTVVLPDETFTGKTCNLYPIVRDEESGQEVPLSTKLTLKVQTLNTTKLTVSLSAKGKLNTVDPDSAIAYTVTKVNNCLGTVESVDLVGVGADAERFQAELDTTGTKPVVLLRLLPGESYATNKTYKVQFRFAVCGREVRSSVLSVKVTQTALKVTAPKTAVYYLSQSGPLRCSLKANLPLESVALSAKTAKEFQQALGGQENLRLIGNRVGVQAHKSRRADGREELQRPAGAHP